jgi:hypothetical protein
MQHQARILSQRRFSSRCSQVDHHPQLPPTGSSWIAVALISASVVHAARGPSPLTVRLMVGHGAGVSGEPGRDAPMLQELEDVSWMAGCRPDAWRPGVIRGRRKGASPAASSAPGFGRRSGSRNVAAEPAMGFPVAGAQQGAASQHVRAPPRRHAE